MVIVFYVFASTLGLENRYVMGNGDTGTMNAQEVNAYTYSTLESYIPLAIGYLLLTYPISYYTGRLEANMKK